MRRQAASAAAPMLVRPGRLRGLSLSFAFRPQPNPPITHPARCGQPPSCPCHRRMAGRPLCHEPVKKRGEGVSCRLAALAAARVERTQAVCPINPSLRTRRKCWCVAINLRNPPGCGSACGLHLSYQTHPDRPEAARHAGQAVIHGRLGGKYRVVLVLRVDTPAVIDEDEDGLAVLERGDGGVGGEGHFVEKREEGEKKKESGGASIFFSWENTGPRAPRVSLCSF